MRGGEAVERPRGQKSDHENCDETKTGRKWCKLFAAGSGG
jgi:hypothetical protein